MDRTDSDNFGSEDASGNQLNTTEARQATTGTGARYVLHISVALVVIAFAIIYFVMLIEALAPSSDSAACKLG